MHFGHLIKYPHCLSFSDISVFPCPLPQVVLLTLLSSWRDPGHVGLTGLELLDSSHHPIDLSPSQLSVYSSGKEMDGEAAALLDGVTLTTSPDHMWLSSLPPCSGVSLSLQLSQPTELVGMRVWNYNRSLEDSYKGVSVA